MLRMILKPAVGQRWACMGTTVEVVALTERGAWIRPLGNGMPSYPVTSEYFELARCSATEGPQDG